MSAAKVRGHTEQVCGAGADRSGCFSTFVSPLLIWHGERTVCSIVLCVIEALSCFLWQLHFCNVLERFFSAQTASTEGEASVGFTFHKGIKIFLEIFFSRIYHSDVSSPPTKG